MNSNRYLISEVILAAVKLPDVFELRDDLVDIHDNPIGPIAAINGSRLLIIKERFDTLSSVEAGLEKRIYVMDLVSINRSLPKFKPRKLVDIDHCAAEFAIRAQLKTLDKSFGVLHLQEKQKVFDIEGLDPGGALIVGTYEIEYRTPKSLAR